MKTNLFRADAEGKPWFYVVASDGDQAENLVMTEMYLGAGPEFEAPDFAFSDLGKFEFDLGLDFQGKSEARFLTNNELIELRRREAAGDFIIEDGKVIATV